MSSTLFVQFVASVPVLCTCIIQLSQVSVNKLIFNVHNFRYFIILLPFFVNLKAQVITTMELLFIALYTPNMVTQLFVPTYYGSDVAEHGEQLLLHITASNWIFATLNYKKLYLMTMGKLRATSFETKVGLVIPLNLNTFVTVSNHAFTVP